MLKRLHEATGPIDILDMVFTEEREVSGAPPWFIYNMVSSVDGATAVKGGSTPLNDEDDKTLFAALRAVADVVLAGAGTVRAESYGPITLDEERRQRRVEVGLAPTPTLVIATRSLALDPEMRVFGDPTHQPVIVTGEDAPQDRVEALSDLADIRQIPQLDPDSIVAALGDVKVVLCEGGPTLNGQLISAGYINEMRLTLAPLLAVGESHRIAHGDELDPPAEMRLDSILKGDRSLFLRYVKT